MNPYDYYITPEEYDRAAINGVSRKTLTRRVRDMAWSKEKAITTPTRTMIDRKHWSSMALQNGISYMHFMSRIRKRWSEERAATQPLASPEQIRENALRAAETRRVIPQSLIDLARNQGVPYKVLHARIGLGWEIDRAASEPIMTPQQKGILGRAKYIQKFGDPNNLVFKQNSRRM